MIRHVTFGYLISMMSSCIYCTHKAAKKYNRTVRIKMHNQDTRQENKQGICGVVSYYSGS